MISLVAITAKPANFRITDLESAMQETVREIEQDFAKTTRTWKRKPRFSKTVKALASSIIGEVSTDSDIYRFISGGTRVRYATMTPGFVAKTVPQWIGSRPGAGGLLRVDRRRPRPGITAREFDKQIARKICKRSIE